MHWAAWMSVRPWEARRGRLRNEEVGQGRSGVGMGASSSLPGRRRRVLLLCEAVVSMRPCCLPLSRQQSYAAFSRAGRQVVMGGWVSGSNAWGAAAAARGLCSATRPLSRSCLCERPFFLLRRPRSHRRGTGTRTRVTPDMSLPRAEKKNTLPFLTHTHPSLPPPPYQAMHVGAHHLRLV